MKDSSFSLMTVFSICAIICTLFLVYEAIDTLNRINDRIDRANVEYQFVVEDRDIIVYDRNRYVGRVRMGKHLDSLITEDNQ